MLPVRYCSTQLPSKCYRTDRLATDPLNLNLGPVHFTDHLVEHGLVYMWTPVNHNHLLGTLGTGTDHKPTPVMMTKWIGPKNDAPYFTYVIPSKETCEELIAVLDKLKRRQQNVSR